VPPLNCTLDGALADVLKLIPILPVFDVKKERAFYEALGFHLHVVPEETYPEDQFAALAFGANVLFGVAHSESAETLTERGLFWQIETTIRRGA
jgi:hypothetical protein